VDQLVDGTLQNYIKFFCFASTILEGAGAYVLGMITDNSYLDGPLFRDMRADLLQCYRSIYITDLGGNSRRVDATAADQNVFDIQQGVAIFLGSTHGETERHIYLSLLRGSRDEKTSWLGNNNYASAAVIELSPAAPQFYFLPSATTSTSWTLWPSLPQIFSGGVRSGRPLPFNGAALATRHDSFAIAFTRSELRENLQIFFDKSETRKTLDERFKLCSSSHFDFERARTEITLAEAESCIRPILYRPFDIRYVVYHPLLIGEPRPDVMKHLLAGSLALLSTRRVTGKPYDNVFVCQGLVEYKAGTHDRNTQVFPLYLADVQARMSLFSLQRGHTARPNLAPQVLAKWRDRLHAHSPEEVFYTIYSMLYSAAYRRLFRDELQRDYARVPAPLSLELKNQLVKIGSELVALHLMHSPKLNGLETSYNGAKSPQVGRVGWSHDTVWLDATAAKKDQAPANGGAAGFMCVPEIVWDFHIGGYQVCEKWLKDRKGRTLSKHDITHYQQIIVALAETIRLMKEIDRLIDAHGGWSEAFDRNVEASETTKARASV
jgi:predicted helicase